MNTVVSINGVTNSSENFITWSPAPGQIQLSSAGGAANPVRVRLKNQTPGQGRQLSFFRTRTTDEGTDELSLDLPTNGNPVEFFVAGKFNKDDKKNYDAAFEVVDSDGNVLSATSVFVRVRRNANGLLPPERELFLSALGKLNDSGNGIFQQFRDMHVENTLDEAHGFAGFLPWHRAYLLDLERELQNLNPRVSLPYWRFDKPAPNLFSKDFMGVSDPNGTVQFTPGHHLEKWFTDGVPGIVRAPLFNTSQMQATGLLGDVISEDDTLVIGRPNHKLYSSFRQMEGQPHGAAHLSFARPVSSISQAKEAARDPLFFLLHANVDRLWALWQFSYGRFDMNNTSTYTTSGGSLRPPNNIGHNLNSTMWPWNLDVTPPRPPTSPVPGGRFPASPIVDTPGLTPRVMDMIDYQGVINAASCLGFDYDDVPF